jgi:hypothetical protein
MMALYAWLFAFCFERRLNSDTSAASFGQIAFGGITTVILFAVHLWGDVSLTFWSSSAKLPKAE